MLGDPQPLAIRSWRAADQLPHSAELLAHAGVGIWESKGSRENGRVVKKIERRGKLLYQVGFLRQSSGFGRGWVVAHEEYVK